MHPRRVAAVCASLAVTWLVLELWFGHRSPRPATVQAAEDGVQPVFAPTEEQLEHWSERLEGLRRGERFDELINVFSARYGWVNEPGARGEVRGAAVSFDSRGIRGTREIAASPPPGALRVACYGDSFTFGMDVGDGDTWAAALEDLSAPELEVLNLGVGGWGTDQALLLFRDTHGELGSDVALMGVLSENIGRNVNRIRTLYSQNTPWPKVKPRFLLAAGELELLPVPYATELELFEAAVDGSLGVDLAQGEYWAERGHRSWSRVVGAVQTARAKARRKRWWELWRDPECEPFQVSVALLEAFRREAHAGGVRFAGVLLFPTRGDLEAGRRLPRLTARLDELGIPYLDLFGPMQARERRGEEVFGRGHFTPDANREVGDAVWSWLREELQL